jgi:hypothetical protein
VGSIPTLSSNLSINTFMNMTKTLLAACQNILIESNAASKYFDEWDAEQISKKTHLSNNGIKKAVDLFMLKYKILNPHLIAYIDENMIDLSDASFDLTKSRIKFERYNIPGKLKFILFAI